MFLFLILLIQEGLVWAQSPMLFDFLLLCNGNFWVQNELLLIDFLEMSWSGKCHALFFEYDLSVWLSFEIVILLHLLEEPLEILSVLICCFL